MSSNGQDIIVIGKTVILFFVSSIVLWGQESPHGQLNNVCSDCHSTDGWNELSVPMKFDHAATGYQLEGQHRITACRNCHTSLKFTGTSRVCVSCHRKDFDAATSINHRTAGFGTDCSQCHRHNTVSWQADFDHNRTQFPTRGAHEAVACTTCHTNNVFRGTPIQCIACHQKEYAAADNPNHQSAKFPTDCALCHRALTWQPATLFPHSYFPIGAGAKHRPGRWNTCGDCHTTQSNYQLFECINCHEHNKSSTDRHHDEVQNYTYQSQACYRCHPQGEAE